MSWKLGEGISSVEIGRDVVLYWKRDGKDYFVIGRFYIQRGKICFITEERTREIMFILDLSAFAPDYFIYAPKGFDNV